MGKRSFFADSTDIRTALDRAGDVEIGAWVGRRRRKRLLVAAAGILLVVMAGVVYSALRFDSGLEQHKGYLAEFQCITCGGEFSRRLDFNQQTPLVCPKCGERSAKQVWICRDCGHKFLPDGPLESVTCPRPQCGSSRVGSAAAAGGRGDEAGRP